MKKYIIQRIKDLIEENSYNWAKNYTAMKWQERLDKPEAKKQVESAKFNMKSLEEQNDFLKKLLKDETKA